MQPLISHKTTSLQKHRFIYFHTKATVSGSACSHKRPVVAGIWQMSASWWSPLRFTWIPVHSMGSEYRIKWSTTAQHQFAHTSQTCRWGLQNELAKFCTIYISYRKSTLLRLIKEKLLLPLPNFHNHISAISVVY